MMERPATPEDMVKGSRSLTALAAVGGTLSARRDREMKYYMFHKRNGLRLRGKYRPQ